MKPVHPILAHFPIALLPLSVAADALAFFARLVPFADTALWMPLAAAVASVATVAAGFYDMYRAPLSEDTHVRVHRHMRVGLALATAIIALAIWRGMIYLRGLALPMFYFDLAVLTVALTVFQGWLGGELVYGDGVFVRAGEAGPAEASEHEGHSHHH